MSCKKVAFKPVFRCLCGLTAQSLSVKTHEAEKTWLNLFMSNVSVRPADITSFTLTQSPLLGEDRKKRLELPVKRCVGVNLQTDRVGCCMPGSRGGQQTRGFSPAPSNLPSQLQNTKQQW